MGMKIVNLNLHRSSTESFHVFMEQHGFRSAHWPGYDFDDRYAEFLPTVDTSSIYEMVHDEVAANEVFGDVPYCFLYREFLTHFPEARYLLIQRDPVEWTASVRRHTGGRPLHNLEKIMYWQYTDVRSDVIEGYSDSVLRDIYSRHNVAIANAIQSARSTLRLFELDRSSLDQKKLTHELADYIGFEVRVPFPTINVSRAF